MSLLLISARTVRGIVMPQRLTLIHACNLSILQIVTNRKIKPQLCSRDEIQTTQLSRRTLLDRTFFPKQIHGRPDLRFIPKRNLQSRIVVPWKSSHNFGLYMIDLAK